MKGKNIIKLIISILLIYMLLNKVNLKVDSIYTQIKNLQINFIILNFVNLILGTIICSLRWKLILQRLNYSVKLIELWKVYMICIFYNTIIPGTISGDFIKGFYLKRYKVGYLESFASVFFDRLSGLTMLMFIGTIMLPLSLAKLKVQLRLILILFFITYIFVFIILFKYNKSLRKIIFSTLYKIGLFKNISKKLIKFLSYINKFGHIIFKDKIIWVSSLLFQLTNILTLYLLFKSTNTNVSFFYISATLPLIVVIIMLPISFQGFGLREYLYYVFYHNFVEQDQIIFIISILNYILTISLGIIGGIINMMDSFLENKNKKVIV